jgi:hypothetical protein
MKRKPVDKKKIKKDVEQAHARIHLCKDMLSMFWWDR